jgi:hypothetical protein
MGARRSALLLPIALAAAPVVLAQTLVVPAFADLTIKTRHRFEAASSQGMTEVLYLKGARERREFLYEQSGNRTSRSVAIVQCDERRRLELNPDATLYSESVIEDWSPRSTRGPAVPAALGADVTTTVETVDTGERRSHGRYVARRVRTTMTVEPSPGANTPPSTRETDGWYIDLPGLGCSGETTAAYVVLGEVVAPGGLRDRHQYKTKGAANRGYAIEETTRFTRKGRTDLHRVELIELSEETLDATLFERPPDYQPALPLLRGGYDMTRPDTLPNRLQMYWEELRMVARAIVR